MPNAVVLGANGNLGPLWLEELDRADYSLTAAGLEPALSNLGRETGGRQRYVQVDITSTTSISNFFSDSGLENLDLLVINAGIDSVPSGDSVETAQVHQVDSWEQVLDVNVTGVVKFLNASINRLNKGARVIVVSSMYSLVSPRLDVYGHMNNGKGWTKNPAYGASKAALNAVVKQYATHLAKAQISFVTVIFGAVAGSQDLEFRTRMASHIPIGSLLSSDDVREAIRFSLSFPKSLSGQQLIFDGGYTLW